MRSYESCSRIERVGDGVNGNALRLWNRVFSYTAVATVRTMFAHRTASFSYINEHLTQNGQIFEIRFSSYRLLQKLGSNDRPVVVLLKKLYVIAER